MIFPRVTFEWMTATHYIYIYLLYYRKEFLNYFKDGRKIYWTSLKKHIYYFIINIIYTVHTIKVVIIKKRTTWKYILYNKYSSNITYTTQLIINILIVFVWTQLLLCVLGNFNYINLKQLGSKNILYLIKRMIIHNWDREKINKNI